MAAFSDRETQLGLRAVLLTVAGLPPVQHRVFDNSYVVPPGQVQPAPYKPTANVEYWTEKYSSGPSFVRGFRTTEHRGLYFVTVFGVPGTDIAAIRAKTDAILLAFPAMQGFALTSGNVVRIRGDQSPYAGEITPIESGHSYSLVTIPWFVLATRPS